MPIIAWRHHHLALTQGMSCAYWLCVFCARCFKCFCASVYYRTNVLRGSARGSAWGLARLIAEQLRRKITAWRHRPLALIRALRPLCNCAAFPTTSPTLITACYLTL